MPGYQNFFATTLFTDIGASDTAITLETVPVETTGRLVLEARNPTQREIISYTGIAGNQITGVVRGIGGTTAKSHTKNSLVEMNLTAEDIEDLYDAFQSFVATNNDWRPVISVPTVTSQDGQKQATLQYPSIDLTGTIFPGTKVRYTRSGGTPTQSFKTVAASSQYASKTSATGTGAITTAATLQATIRWDSYTGGVIFGNANPAETVGIKLRIESDGRFGVQWFSSGVNRLYTTYMWLQPGKTYHVAASVTFATNQALLYVDGVVQGTVVNSAYGTGFTTNNTIYLGGTGAGGQYFDGVVSDARMYSVARTEAQIRADMNSYPASNANMVAWYKGEGSWNDSSSNANHLTATNGAINNFAYHPWKDFEYGIVTSVVLASGNTNVTVYTGNMSYMPNVISASSYSMARNPYGFPASRNAWTIRWYTGSEIVQSAPTVGVWYFAEVVNMLTPIGEWKMSLGGNGQNIPGGNPGSIKIALATNTTPTMVELIWAYSANTTVHFIQAMRLFQDRTVTTPTIFKGMVQGSTSNTIGWRDGVEITAECAYL